LKWIVRVLVALVLLAGSYAVYRLVFPPDGVIIRKQLRELSEAVSFDGQARSPLALVAGAGRVASFFTDDAQIQVGDVPGAGRRVIQGRDELREAVAGWRGVARSARVRLREVYIDRLEGREAVTQIIVGVWIDGAEDEFIQEFRLGWIKEGRSWLIREVEPVASLSL
jgi:hypothetical protein